jgi:hypothetical protein
MPPDSSPTDAPPPAPDDAPPRTAASEQRGDRQEEADASPRLDLDALRSAAEELSRAAAQMIDAFGKLADTQLAVLRDT